MPQAKKHVQIVPSRLHLGAPERQWGLSCIGTAIHVSMLHSQPGARCREAEHRSWQTAMLSDMINKRLLAYVLSHQHSHLGYKTTAIYPRAFHGLKMVFGLNNSVAPFKGQKYNKLKKQCLKAGKLFVDSTFPPNGNSLFYSRTAPADIVWKRPKDLTDNPRFFLDSASADDFSQGSLGNCWFVSACACIAEDPRLWKKLIPDYDEQEWGADNKYAGIFHFQFWRCGQWVDVVIDDYLPTRSGRLIYVHSKTKNEFWSALLEKAYAKLFGDYESLTAGKAKDAMVDMTGGVGENIDMQDYRSEENRKKLFKILHEAFENRSLIAASIVATGPSDMEARLSCGLVKGHAYSITDVRKITLGKGLVALFKNEKLRMIRCRNPWGGTEWRGPWSDGSSEWKKVSESEKKDMGLVFDENGEFWMAFEDFCRYFTNLDICHVINRSFFSFKKTWREGKAVGEWRRPDRCGGCGNYSSFLDNPQYAFDIEEETDNIMISLEQNDKRVDKNRGASNDTIGITILKTDLNRKCRLHDRLERIHASPFVNSRSIFTRVSLKRGRYSIIPSTFDPNKLGLYVLRMYCSIHPNLRELVHNVPQPKKIMCMTFTGPPRLAATQITIVRGENLEGQDSGGTSDPYCIIKCEKKEVWTKSCEKTVNPEWKERATFYRKKPDQDIVIEVWNHNIIKDELMGVCTLPMANKKEYTGGNTIRRYDLYGRGKEATVKKQGYLWLKVLHTADISAV
ncbi:hypothetical protein ScPMuIL_017408 [Solemya velum]